jgi:hypothetical protein
MEKQISAESGDHAIVLEITLWAERTESGVQRILSLLDRGRLPEAQYNCLSYSSWSWKVPLQSFLALMKRLARIPPLRELALRMVWLRLHHMPQDADVCATVALDLATDPLLIRTTRLPPQSWSEVAGKLVATHARPISRAIFAAQSKQGQSQEAHWFLEHSFATNVLVQCIEHDSAGVWAELVNVLENDANVSLFLIGFPAGLIERLPQGAILAWAAVDPKNRAGILAHFVNLYSLGDDSLAAKLISQFGHIRVVDSSLFSSLVSGGPVNIGNFADQWTGKIKHLEELRKWARHAVRQLREMEERDRIYDAERELLTHG